MSDVSTTTPTIDPTTDAWRDYVAVVVNGNRPTDVADVRGITPSTVSANVRRIRDALARGAAMPDGTDTDGVTVTVFPPFDTWVASTYDDATAFVVGMVNDAMRDIDRDVTRATNARDDAIRRIDAANDRRAHALSAVAGVMPDGVTFDGIMDAYTTARDAAGATAPTDTDAGDADDAPTDDDDTDA